MNFLNVLQTILLLDSQYSPCCNYRYFTHSKTNELFVLQFGCHFTPARTCLALAAFLTDFAMAGAIPKIRR